MTNSNSQTSVSGQRKNEILLPRRYTCPVRVKITQLDGESDTVCEYVVSAPFSIGHGKHCEVKLPKRRGPDQLFEFASIENSQSISLPLQRAIKEGDFKIYLDGEQVSDSDVSIKPGSSLRILDNSGDELVEVSVGTPESWKRHLKSLYAISTLFLIAFFLIAYLIFINIQKAEQRFEETDNRLTKTESSLFNTNTQLEIILMNFESRQMKLEQSL